MYFNNSVNQKDLTVNSKYMQNDGKYVKYTVNEEYSRLQNYLSNRKEEDIIKDEKYFKNSQLKKKIKEGIDKFFGWEEINEENKESIQKDLQLSTQEHNINSSLLVGRGLDNTTSKNSIK